MKNPIHFAMAAALVLAAAATAGAEPAMYARVSFEEGGALVRGAKDDEWSFARANSLVLPDDTLWADEGSTLEVEVPGGSFLRMADGSKAEVQTVHPDAVVNAWTGAFYVQRVARSTGSFTLTTPACEVEVHADSMVRIDVLEAGATTVSVRWGYAVIRTQQGTPMVVKDGKRSFVDPGLLPSTPLPFDRTEEDPFDRWNSQRAKLIALGKDAFPGDVQVEQTPVGYADLSSHGEWVYIDKRPYWRPTVVVDYVPYRSGYWSYVPSCGHVWVGSYPFSYVTSHYGRWTHHATYGWVWCYRDTWGPAWVASVRYGPNFVWCPLDPWDRPVTFGTAAFTIGDVHFSITASSYCGVNELLLGPCGVYACRPAIVHPVPSTQIHVWNIYAPDYGRPAFSLPPTYPVRDYSPRRVIRGPSHTGSRGAYAVARARSLESSLGRGSFATVSSTGSRNTRTTYDPASRSARMRSVSVNPETTLNTRAAVQRVERSRGLSTSSSRAGIRNRASTSSARTHSAPHTATATDTRTRTSAPSRTTRRADTPTRQPSSSPAPSTRPAGTSSRVPERTTVPSSRTARSTPSERTAPRATTSVRAPSPSRGAPSDRAATSRTVPSTRVPTVSRSAPSTRTTAPRTSYSTPAPMSRTVPATRTPSVGSPSRSSLPTRSVPSVGSPSRSSLPTRSSPSVSNSSRSSLPTHSVPSVSLPSRSTSSTRNTPSVSSSTRSAPSVSRPAPSAPSVSSSTRSSVSSSAPSRGSSPSRSTPPSRSSGGSSLSRGGSRRGR